jgi:hypothetical protein
MTETETKWTERVKEWKASGKTAKEFTQGCDFKPSTLTYWAHRVRRLAEQPAKPVPGATVRLARLVRIATTDKGATQRKNGVSAELSGSIVVELGRARIVVQAGFDRQSLTTVLEVLAAQSGESAR